MPEGLPLAAAGAAPGQRKRSMKPEELTVLIYDALYSMGFKGDCSGFFFLSHAVYLSLTHPGDLSLISAWLYPAVARHYRTDVENVSRHVSAAIARAWRTNREQMVAAIGHPLKRCPIDWEIIRYLYEDILKAG